MELHFLGRTKNTDMGSSDIFQVNFAPTFSGGPYALEKLSDESLASGREIKKVEESHSTVGDENLS